MVYKKNYVSDQKKEIFFFFFFYKIERHTDILRNKWKKDYEETFIVTDNGTISASNDNIRKVQEFIKTYNSFFRFEGIEVNDLDLESAGHRQIRTVNKTKKEILKLLGVANHIYIKACKLLDVQPSAKHFSATFI
ncbi:unnamed protein product [Rhizophagus irregularis]|nr:unnamed protein product [Rhizophagus irregularis]